MGGPVPYRIVRSVFLQSGTGGAGESCGLRFERWTAGLPAIESRPSSRRNQRPRGVAGSACWRQQTRCCTSTAQRCTQGISCIAFDTSVKYVGPVSIKRCEIKSARATEFSDE